MPRRMLLTFLLTFCSHVTAATLPNLSGGPPWPHGAGQIEISGGYDNWKQWMQHDADIVTVWSAKASTWADFETGKGDVGYYFTQALKYLPKTTQIVHSYPMLPEAVSNRNCQNPEVWDQFARGDFDKYYQTMAQNMKALIVNSGRDPSTVILRLGWEMNGDWYPWSVCNKVSQFKQSWERAIVIVRSVMPGMLVDFSVSRPYLGYTAGRNYNGTAGVSLEGFLPSDSTYSVISRSHHDGNAYTTSDSSWQQTHISPDPSKKVIGLRELVDVAKAHGKKFALSEWGTQMADCDATWKTAPNPALFIQKTYEFLYANKADLAWDTHFSVSCTALHSRQSSSAAQTYKTLWGSDETQPKPPSGLSVD